MNHIDTIKAHSPEAVAKASIKTFFNICEKWDLTVDEILRLLGTPSRATFFKWKRGEVSKLSQDQLTRVSIVLGVYKALRILFPTEEQANKWLSKPNTHFGGEPAKVKFCSGNILSMIDVRRYLDAIRGLTAK